MPKITKQTYRIDGKDVVFDLRYSPKYGHQCFYVNLPTWMSGVLNLYERQEAKTQYELEHLLDSQVKRYGELKATEEKVIFYQFLSQIRELNFDGDNRATQSEEKQEMLSEGVAMDLWFRVGYVIKNPAQNKLIFVDENHADKTTHWCLRRRMPYTENRLEFFVAFRDWLITGVERMQAFFKESSKLPQIMDQMLQNNTLPFQRALPMKETTTE